MVELLIGHARVSTDAQDLTAQRAALSALGVTEDRLYVDHGLTGTHRNRPGLRQALAACRAGDTVVVTKLDRLARSLPDARDIVDELTRRQVKLNLGGSIHDPTDPDGRLLFNVLAMVAEFEADMIRARARARACRSPSPRAAVAGSSPSSCVRTRERGAAGERAHRRPDISSRTCTARRHLGRDRDALLRSVLVARPAVAAVWRKRVRGILRAARHDRGKR